MKYFIYKTTNITNGKYYIGKHETSNEDDGYLGSGVALQKAIKKYGRNNFQREILVYTSSSNELNDLEKQFITDDILSSSESYNCAPGGNGGNTIKNYSTKDKQKVYEKISNKLKGRVVGKRRSVSPLRGRCLSNEHKEKISSSLKGKNKPPRSKEHSKKISDALKGRTIENNIKQSMSVTMKDNHANTISHTCPHCGKTGKSGVMKRWHFDNCQSK